MFPQYTTPVSERIATSPRNAWTKFLAALEAAEAGDFYYADRLLDLDKYTDDLPDDVFRLYRDRVDALRSGTGPARINIPADYLSYTDAVLHPPIRSVRADSDFPKPYPFGMSLPRLVGGRNEFSFLQDAATHLAGQVAGRVARVHVLHIPVDTAGVQALQADLAAQRFDGAIRLTVFAGQDGTVHPMPPAAGGIETDAMEMPLLGPGGADRLDAICRTADLVVFLTGRITLDPLAIERMARLARIGDNALQPVMDMEPGHRLDTPFTTHRIARRINPRYPFRDIQGLNFALTPALIRRAGRFETRFASTALAAREFAYRLFRLGSYFVPLAVPAMSDFRESEPSRADIDLYVNLCPNHWDRKLDGTYEVPKVSIYIPAYNAAKYMRRAVDSVLEQDLRDLEVCISNDGSRDRTLEVLERHYGDDARVRWVDNANGGIGFASNKAIDMARGLYIGQLDSDDALKPGAVRRLAEYLDNHPETACAYGSCERIDASGKYIKDEYSWPVFSREKMMITSIAHHFRMFRRAAWERTTRFREDIVNAVDYDIFLKMAETGEFHHVEETLYQRRWHGENTSNVNEGFQTSNTYRVQREALKRLGLDRFWDVHVPDPKDPRRVTYARREGRGMVLFWPDYSHSNPYQKLLYGTAARTTEICAGTIDAALRMIEDFKDPSQLTFHLHWLNFLFAGITDPVAARTAVDDFLEKLRKFRWKGGRIVWTIHNTISHDTPYHEIETDLSAQVAEIADTLHFHSAASIPEVEQAFAIPAEKVRISRHGNYNGIYPDFITRAEARAALDIEAEEDVILFLGQVRPYKGVEQLIAVVRDLLAERPHAVLLIAGYMGFDPLATLTPGLTPAERARIRTTGRFADAMELQVFFRAADMAVYPYARVLTSGSLLLALSFGVPVVIPAVGMTREVLDGADAGATYDPAEGIDGLRNAVAFLLARKDAGTLDDMAENARRLGDAQDWPDFTAVLDIAEPAPIELQSDP